MPKDQVAKVQQALQQQGYDPGVVDGTWGPASEEALKEFQTNRSLPASHGQIDSMTLHALHVAAH
jgi:peptidoglycan hydrolase-like protein with peptidoglycan-binding domain